ncbi:MAG: hypothetical protein H6602_13215 [Flavobacteriales bacterium]|nr:hypothetical protein [Flavobacteriales bacterium]
MIKFFRKIRQGLLAENKFTKYLAYALGEIILVVIGILIALQLHNWSDYKKERIAETKLLQNLLEDLNRDSVVFDVNIQNNRFHIAVLDTMLHEISFNPDYNIMDFLRHNKAFPFFGKFLATKGSYVESLSSGKLSLILSDSLRKEILAYYEVDLHTLGADKIVDYDMNVFRTEWNDLISHSQEYGLVMGVATNFPNMSVKEITSDPRYRKLLMQKRGLVRAQIEGWQRVKAINAQLRHSIVSELERRED